jgi:hypothetical protein
VKRVTENKRFRKILQPDREEVKVEDRKVHNEQLQNFHFHLLLLEWLNQTESNEAGHVARMGEMKNAYKISVDKSQWKRAHGRHRRKWEDNIKMVFINAVFR